MFVDSASKWMRPYGMKKNSETTAYVQKLIADMNVMGRPHCSRTDNGGEFTSRSYVDYCDPVGVRREYTAPGKPQQDTVVESVIWHTIKGGHAVRLDLAAFSGCRSRPNPQHRRQRQLSVVIDCSLGCRLLQPFRDQGQHRMAVVARGFFSRLSDPQVVPFFQESRTRVDRSTKSDVQSVLCYFMNNGHNHSSSTVK